MASKTSVDIFQYSDSVAFMNGVFQELKEKRPQYSLRAWAVKLEISNSGTLSQILSGKRLVTPALIARFSDEYGLTPDEVAYFEFLVLCSQRMSETSFNFCRDLIRKGIQPNAQA